MVGMARQVGLRLILSPAVQVALTKAEAETQPVDLGSLLSIIALAGVELGALEMPKAPSAATAAMARRDTCWCIGGEANAVHRMSRPTAAPPRLQVRHQLLIQAMKTGCERLVPANSVEKLAPTHASDFSRFDFAKGERFRTPCGRL
jgi:hypothetical protein